MGTLGLGVYGFRVSRGQGGFEKCFLWAPESIFLSGPLGQSGKRTGLQSSPGRAGFSLRPWRGRGVVSALDHAVAPERPRRQRRHLVVIGAHDTRKKGKRPLTAERWAVGAADTAPRECCAGAWGSAASGHVRPRGGHASSTHFCPLPSPGILSRTVPPLQAIGTGAVTFIWKLQFSFQLHEGHTVAKNISLPSQLLIPKQKQLIRD